MTYNIVTLSDNGILIDEAKRILNAVGLKFGKEFSFTDCSIGTRAKDLTGTYLPEQSIENAKRAHAVLFEAAHGAKCAVTQNILSTLAEALGLYAELRFAKLYPCLKQKSALNNENISKGIDVVTVFDVLKESDKSDGGFRANATFGREAYDVVRYSELEIERTARIAYELSQTRKRRLTLTDKADRLTTSKLWRKIVTDINEDYPFVQVDTVCASECAVQLALNPSQFDVILTSEAFGDILANLASAFTGSVCITPSAILGETTLGIYGATPSCYRPNDSVNCANPVGTVLSAGLMLRHSFDMQNEADCIEKAVEKALSEGCLTLDMGGSLSTAEMTDAIIARL